MERPERTFATTNVGYVLPKSDIDSITIRLLEVAGS
jgi:hypothetical protein